MYHYAITTQEEFDQAKAYIIKKHTARVGIVDIVNGIYESDKVWRVYNPVKQNLFTGAIPASTSNGNCLRMMGDGTNIVMDSASCSASVFWSICELAP